MNCPYCGNDMAPGTIQCGKCGGVLQRASAAPPMQQGGYPPYGYVDYQAKSKIAAGLLGIFLGFFGVHRFYLGYTGIGIAQLLLTIATCGIGYPVSHIWGLIEGIMILAGSINTDADGRPLRD